MCQVINHYEIVGSFLRPEKLKQAREAFAEGKITRSELKEVEDQAISELVAKQKEVGLKYVSDGEFRRSYWHLDFFLGISRNRAYFNGSRLLVPWGRNPC